MKDASRLEGFGLHFDLEKEVNSILVDNEEERDIGGLERCCWVLKLIIITNGVGIELLE